MEYSRHVYQIIHSKSIIVIYVIQRCVRFWTFCLFNPRGVFLRKSNTFRCSCHVDCLLPVTRKHLLIIIIIINIYIAHHKHHFSICIPPELLLNNEEMFPRYW